MPVNLLQIWETYFDERTSRLVTPLLRSRYTLKDNSQDEKVSTPLFGNCDNFHAWIATWTRQLVMTIEREKCQNTFFRILLLGVRHDESLARYLLPYVISTVLCMSSEQAKRDIKSEISAVLREAAGLENNGASENDKTSKAGVLHSEKTRSAAQTISAVLSYFKLYMKHMDPKKNRGSLLSKPATREAIEAIVNEIHKSLLAQALLCCKAYPQSLRYYEEYLREGANLTADEQQAVFSQIESVFHKLEDVDSIAGMASMIDKSTPGQRILQYISAGQWPSAQMCYSIVLRGKPNDDPSHIGLLECLRNLGQYGRSKPMHYL